MGVFSDWLPEYTKTWIYLNNFTRPEDFNDKIAKTPHLNFRTRIDLGFKLAEEEVLLEQNGARSDARRLIFLVTDGKQTPQVDDFDSNIKLDPVKASENLWNDKNTAIFTVGVGPKIDEVELRNIARQPEAYIKAEDLDTLITDDFVKRSARSSCTSIGRAEVPTVDEIKGESEGVCPEKQSQCCETKNTYVTIFQEGSSQVNNYNNGASKTTCDSESKTTGDSDSKTTGEKLELKNVDKDAVDLLVQKIKNAMGSDADIKMALNSFIEAHSTSNVAPSPVTPSVDEEQRRGGSNQNSK